MQKAYIIIVILICLILVVGLTGCSSKPLPVPPPPVLTTSSAPAETSPVASGSVTQSSVTPVTDTPPLSADFIINSNKAEVDFPDTITFSLSGKSSAAIQKISLIYGTEKRALVTETNYIQPEVQSGQDFSASWTWLMKKTGSLPPGAVIWWQWETTDDAGNTSVVPRETLVYIDSRFTWQTTQLEKMDIYWHDQDEALIQEITGEVDTRLSRLELDVAIPEERKPRVFIYRSSDELKGAVLHEQEWTGALAFLEYNIILTALNPGILDWAKQALPHEIAHLIVAEAVSGPFGDIPTWLNEGLAEYAGGEMPDYLEQTLKQAFRSGSLISVRSLIGGFPADPSLASLAYAESQSLVEYLLDTWGWDKMNGLLSVFKAGATCDGALQEVYGFDSTELEKRWKAAITEKYSI